MPYFARCRTRTLLPLAVALALASACVPRREQRVVAPPPSVPVREPIENVPVLWVVDGRVLSDSVARARVRPDEVDRMEVLKGTAAVARFGRQAAGGAVIVTTKKGTARQE